MCILLLAKPSRMRSIFRSIITGNSSFLRTWNNLHSKMLWKLTLITHSSWHSRLRRARLFQFRILFHRLRLKSRNSGWLNSQMLNQPLLAFTWLNKVLVARLQRSIWKRIRTMRKITLAITSAPTIPSIKSVFGIKSRMLSLETDHCNWFPFLGFRHSNKVDAQIAKAY